MKVNSRPGQQPDEVVLGADRLSVLLLPPGKDRTLTYTVAHLSSDEAVRLRCDCRVRTFGRAELASLVGRGARMTRPSLGASRSSWEESRT